ncbi:hypothetical protein V6N12_009378 [Hibiscus sabdariffa]|uniref:RNase H type-1 domain-containing protein n=1 Tax=Hibiscus sabdariffa TaxID=183260 RepID=A0ABR2E8Z5_9ROSI
MGFKQWLFINLLNNDGFGCDRTHWDVLFGYLLWDLWRKRNEWVFGEHNHCGNSVLQRSLRILHEATAGRSLLGAIRPLSCTSANVLGRWVKPPQGWCKLNTDGAVNRSPGMVSSGGVVRNEEGNWLIDFDRRLGVCSVLEVELWGLFEGY